MLFSPKNHPRPSHQGWLTGDRIAEIKNSNVRKPSERGIASSTSEFRIIASRSDLLAVLSSFPQCAQVENVVAAQKVLREEVVDRVLKLSPPVGEAHALLV